MNDDSQDSRRKSIWGCVSTCISVIPDDRRVPGFYKGTGRALTKVIVYELHALHPDTRGQLHQRLPGLCAHHMISQNLIDQTKIRHLARGQMADEPIWTFSTGILSRASAWLRSEFKGSMHLTRVIMLERHVWIVLPTSACIPKLSSLSPAGQMLAQLL